MVDYDIKEAVYRIEMELLESMIRNMKNHRAEETEKGFEWTQWQALQLKAMEEYKRRNKEKFKPEFKDINQKIRMAILQANAMGKMVQEAGILKAIKEGFSLYRKSGDTMAGKFFHINDKKINALIEATIHDMEKAETAILRMSNDQYRKAIFNAQVYANSGAGTYEKAVDMATKDMLAAGLNCVQYQNGARHTLENYADMALRTASKRAYLQGEGDIRKAWGIHTVIMNKRGNACPLCLPWVGRVLIDDVWSGGTAEEAKELGYPLMSMAVDTGLYHPNCRDAHTTYFEGINTQPDKKWTKEELEEIEKNAKREAKEQYEKRQAEKFNRLEKFSLDIDNKKKYAVKAAEWKKRVDAGQSESDIKKEYRLFQTSLGLNKRPSLHKDKMLLYSKYTELFEDLDMSVPFVYVESKDIIKYNPKHPNIEGYDMDYAFAHELSHRMDVLEYHSWENKNFVNAIETCRGKVYAQKEQVQKWFEPRGKYENSFALSDIISALSDEAIEVTVGHEIEYWDSDKRHRPMEIFANLSSIDVLDLDENEEMLEELFEAYKGMIR